MPQTGSNFKRVPLRHTGPPAEARVPTTFRSRVMGGRERQLRNCASARMWDARMLSHPAGQYVGGFGTWIAAPAIAPRGGGPPHIGHVSGVEFRPGRVCGVGARLPRSVRPPGGGARAIG